MSPEPLCVAVSQTMGAALEQLNASGRHELVVTDRDMPVGVLTADDLLAAQHWPATTEVGTWMSARMLTLPGGMALWRAAAHALCMKLRHVIVMGEQGMRGIVTSSDFVRGYADAPST